MLLESIFGGNAVMMAARVVAFLTAIPFHELAHAYVSDKLGDHTARNAGRLTMNPLKHFDPWGLLAMLVIGVGWAKPVPVDSSEYPNRKWGMAVTAFAGPASNFVLGYVLFAVFKVFTYSTGTSWGAVFTYAAGEMGLAEVSAAAGVASWAIVVALVLYYLVSINITLGLFNLLPVPPLDGSRIFFLVLPERWYFAVQKYERYIMIGLLAVIFILPYVLGFSPLGWLLGSASGYVIQGFNWATGYIDAIFGALMGG